MIVPLGIDAALFRARCLGNDALMAELLRLFAQHAPVEVARMRAAMAGGDLVVVRASAHNLKSGAGTIAATTLHALLVECERDPTPDRVAAVERELPRCLP